MKLVRRAITEIVHPSTVLNLAVVIGFAALKYPDAMDKIVSVFTG